MKKVELRSIFIIFLCSILSFIGILSSEQVWKNNSDVLAENGYEVMETNIPFTQNGKTEYVIMLPNVPTERENYAAKELQTYLELSTGVSFSIVNELSVSSNRSFISVGETESLKKNVSYNAEELGSSGFVIQYKNGNIYIVGGEDLGTIYGVYEFLGVQVGYEYYSYDCIVYNENANTTVKKVDIKKIPAFDYRLILDGTIWRYNERMWQYGYDLPYIGGTHSMHNSMSILSMDKYYAEHPNWYAGSKLQVCYSAADEYVDVLCEYFQNKLLEDSEKSGKVLLFFGQMDSAGYCTCDKCNKAVAKYGNITATIIQCLNLLSDRMKPWIDEHQPGREVIFGFFAYQWSQYAPVSYDEKTNTFSFSEDIRMNDNVGVLLAPIHADYYIPYSHEKNKQEKLCIESWMQITDHFMYYGYDSSFATMMYSLNTFNKRIEDYKWLSEIGVEFVLEQKPVWTSNSWQDWAAYRYFTTAELMWNPNADFNALTNEFFNAYYREGADSMLMYFNEWRRHWEVLYSRYDIEGSIYIKQNDTKFWSMSLLNRWLGYTGEALTKIERYKYFDMDLYEKLYSHIEQERIRLEYQLIDLYGSVYYTQDELFNAKIRVLNGMRKYEMMMTETNNVTLHLQTLKEQWGIK